MLPQPPGPTDRAPQPQAQQAAPAATPPAPGTVGASTSLSQPGYLGAPATVAPTTYAAQGANPQVAGANSSNAAQLDLHSLLSQWQAPTQASAVGNVSAPGLDSGLLNSLGSNQTIAALLQGFAPQAAQSTQNLNQTLANFGVTGGQNVAANTQLQAQLAAALSPSIASAIQNSQGNQLNAGEFGAGQTQQANLANQSTHLSQNNLNAQLQGTNVGQQNSALLSALGINTSNQQQTNLANQQAQNQGMEFNANAVNQGNQFNANAGNQAGQFNANSSNAAANYNANAQNATNAANVSQFNNSNQTALNQMINDYLAQLGQFGNINGAGQNAGNQNAINYGQDISTSDPLGELIGAAKAAAPFIAGA